MVCLVCVSCKVRGPRGHVCKALALHASGLAVARGNAATARPKGDLPDVQRQRPVGTSPGALRSGRPVRLRRAGPTARGRPIGAAAPDGSSS